MISRWRTGRSFLGGSRGQRNIDVQTVKWRTGSEGWISSLKRGYSWDRTRLDGTEAARIWTGHGSEFQRCLHAEACAWSARAR